MRIVGGTLSGRKLAPPLSITTRPMMDRVRQALFNILEHNDWGRNISDAFADAHVLDAFCGTGALAYEAISRGAAHAYLFDKDRQALKVAEQNAKSLGVDKQCTIQQMDATAPAKTKQPCKLVFLAPPYKKDLIPPAMIALDKAGWMVKHPLIVAETAKKEKLEIPEGFKLEFSRFYGDTGLHFIVR